jgi:hypothetical protein
MTTFEWTPVRYRNVISVLKNPFYAGAYIYGKSGHRTEIVNGRAQKTYGHGDAKSGRGGQALLVGLLGCARCGRRLKVAYQGRSARAYRCDSPNLMLGSARCLTFGSSRVDPAVARELLRAVEPIAVEAAVEAERLRMERVNERRHILDLDLQKACYEASLAERRYAACDPDNRLIAAQLEKSWEAALRRVEECQARLEPETRATERAADGADFVALARDLETAWTSPNVSMRSRALVVDISLISTKRRVRLFSRFIGVAGSILNSASANLSPASMDAKRPTKLSRSCAVWRLVGPTSILRRR